MIGGDADEDVELSGEGGVLAKPRTEDKGIQYLEFLWGDYKPHCWFYEVFEM